MTTSVDSVVSEACRSVGNDPTRLMDVAREIQSRFGCVSPEAMDAIQRDLGLPRLTVQSLVSFYSFLSEEPQGPGRHPAVRRRGRPAVRLRARRAGVLRGARHRARPDDARRRHHPGADGLHRDERPGPGRAGERRRRCTDLSTDQAREIVAELRAHMTPERLVKKLGDGNNAHQLVRSMVRNHIRQAGPIVLTEVAPRRGHPQGRGHEPHRGHPRRQDRAPAGPRRGRVPHRHQVGDGAGGARRAQVRGLQRRRGRAGHVQGPRAADRAAGPRLRGHDHRRLRHRGPGGHPLPARRVRLPAALPRGRPGPPPGRRAARPAHRGPALLRLRHPHPDGRGRLRLRRGVGAAQLVRGAAGRPAQPAALPGPARLPRLPHGREQRRDPGLRDAHPGGRAGARSPSTAPSRARAPSCSASPATSAGPASTRCRSA